MISSLLYTIGYYAVQVLVWLIIIRVFLSYIPHNPHNAILRFIYEMTEPVLSLAGRILPNSLRAPIDFTPIVALLVLQFLAWPILKTVLLALPI